MLHNFTSYCLKLKHASIFFVIARCLFSIARTDCLYDSWALVSVRLSENEEIGDFAGEKLELIAWGTIRRFAGWVVGVEGAVVGKDLVCKWGVLDGDFLWLLDVWPLDETMHPFGPKAGNFRRTAHFTISLHIQTHISSNWTRFVADISRVGRLGTVLDLIERQS